MSSWATIQVKSYEVHDSVNGLLGDDLSFDEACELTERERALRPNNLIEVHAIVDA